MRAVKRWKKITGMTVLALIMLFLINIWISGSVLSETVYEYRNERIRTGFTVVQLTDLHNRQFGWKNRRLVERVRMAQPDVIFLTGDMLNDDEERTDIVENLIRELCTLAPVYVSPGNHESAYMEMQENGFALREILEKAGAVVLDKQYVDTNINGQDVRIGGVYGYVLKEEWEDGSEQRFMEEFEKTDRLKLLLCHMPDGLSTWKSMERWKVDLAFCGHLHGGQVRIPFLGGVYGVETGFFPEYTKGKYLCGNGTMILSAGLGNSGFVPRINNPPEVVVCKVRPQG